MKRSTDRTFLVFGLLALAAAWLVGCSPPAPETETAARAVAVWDDGRLEREEYASWLTLTGLEDSPESIRKLALVKSLAQAARERGAVEAPEVQLAAEAARHRILLPALDAHMRDRISITDEEIENLHASHPDAFGQPRKLFLRGIYKQLPQDETERAGVRRRMQALRAQVLAGAELEALAAAESESQSRFRNGSIGFVDPETLPPAVRDGVRDLQVGEVSPLIELPAGLAFYACERIKPAVQPSAEEIRQKFRQNLFRQKRAELNAQLNEELAGRIKVSLSGDPVLEVGHYKLPASSIDPLVRQRLPDLNPEDLSDRQKRRLLREWGTRVAMADYAESIGLGESEDRAIALEWRLEQALATSELRHRVDNQLRPPAEEQMRERFDQRKHRLRNPPTYRVAAIQFARPGETESAHALDRARDILARIHAGELPFHAAAREFSIHPSGRHGGEFDWMTQSQLGSLDIGLLRPLRELAPGEDTGLMRLESGLWVLKLLERREATPMTFGQAREQLAEALTAQQIERLEAEVRVRQLENMNLQIATD